MENFVFYNPTKIIFGKNTLSKIGKETASFGRKVLLVYGCGSIKQNNIYQKVTQSLSEAGMEIIEHPGVRSNPVLSHVRSGIDIVKKYGCQVVCAVGGGSVIDESKAICAGSVVEHDVWKFFTGKKSLKNTLPLTCVVTLAASGSEMNNGMVITNEKKQQKFGFGNQRLFPKASILDPETTFSVSPPYTAYGAVDAICHVLEFYFTTKVKSPTVQDRLIEGLVINIMEGCQEALKDPTNYHARANLMWCSSLALNGLTAAGLGRVGFPMHMIEHSLSALYDIPHGAGLSVIMPAWMKFYLNKDPERICQFGQRIFGLETDGSIKSGQSTINQFLHWLRCMKCPTTLEELSIPKSEIDKIADNAIYLANIWRLSDYDKTTITSILELC